MGNNKVVVTKARAKLNLCLAVTGKVGAKHALDTVIVPIDLYDTVVVTKAEKTEIFYDGKKSPYSPDIVAVTIEKLSLKYNFCGVRVEITKRIPEKAGVGGSSADAAAVIRGIEKLYGFVVDDYGLLEELGSDLAAMYIDAPCRMRGIGREVEPIEVPDGMRFCLLLPKEGVGTRECFGRYDDIGGQNPDVDEIVRALQKREYFFPGNALTAAATELNADIAEGLRLMEEVGFRCGMTGSGSGVFGYEYDDEKFETKKSALFAKVGKKYRVIAL